MSKPIVICVLLVLAVLAVFGQTAGFDFVNYDDSAYVYENARVMGGLSLPGIAWAFTHMTCSLYHPLTILSLMLDYQLHGLHPGGYHLTNVLLHAASSVLLFLVLRRMTGALWRSAFVAALFAVHPLRAESVAWVAERKDVLATFFFMLTLAAYVRYVREPGSVACYLAVVGGFVLALLSKPTVVTLPFVLLLLDYWPLRRFALHTPADAAGTAGKPAECFGIPKRLLLEKVPLLALAAVAGVVTVFAAGKAIGSTHDVAMSVRAGNALVSYVVYLRQMVWPAGLAAFYPYPAPGRPFWEITAAFLLLTVISCGALVFWRKRPWLFAGWCWYLVMLVPMIGVIQKSAFAHADRNTYLPQIGLYLLVTWAVADLAAGWRHGRSVQALLAATVLAALMFQARAQTSYWRNGESLWTRVLACTSAGGIARNNLGLVFYNRRDMERAIAQYQKALDLEPDYAEARNNLGSALFEKGDLLEAIAQYQKALEIQPDYAEARNNLGFALERKGDTDGAIAQYRKALEYHPDYEDAHFNQGIALFRKGDTEAAIAQYRQALQIRPDDAAALNCLGLAQAKEGRLEEAIASYRQALSFKPDQLSALNNLAWPLATASDASLRNGAEAVALAEQANRLSGGANPIVLHTLAAAYAETGRYAEATVTARRARELAAAQKNGGLDAMLEKEMQLYEPGTPVRETRPGDAR